MSGPVAGYDPRAAVAVELSSDHAGAVVAARVRSEGGAWIDLHDTPDPLSTAHAQLASVSAAQPEVIVVVGAGLGFLTEAASARWPETAIVVVEPLAALADAARQRTPALHASGRVHLLTGPDYAGADDLWRVFDAPHSTGAPPPIVADPGLGRAMPELTRQAARVVGRAVAAARMNQHARAENAGRYVVNTLRNLRHVVRGPNPERLRGRFTAVPAVVVGAGPSLDRNVHALRAVAGRALVIATDTAWRPLVAGGVSPHLVVALDPTPANGRHLMDVPAPLDSWVVAEGSVDPEALAGLTGRVATFRVGTHHPWPWLQDLGVDRLQLRAWGSVLTSAFDLAVVCGCGPIVFVGADLGFTGGQPYCRGTSMEGGWARHTARGVSVRQVWQNTLASRPLVTVPGVEGGDVLTAPHLVEFRDWLVARAAETAPGRVVNASGAGIFVGPHVRQASVSEVLAPCPHREHTLRDTLRDALDVPEDLALKESVATALAVLAQGEAASAVSATTLADWVAFGRPTLTTGDLQAAARTGGDAIGAEPTAPASTAAMVPLRWHVADRVAAMRARLTGDATGLDGGAPPPFRAAAVAAAEAAQRLDELLRLPLLATGVGEDVAAGAAPALVPLSCRFVWTSAAAPLVAAAEEALIEAAVPTAKTAASGEDYWTEPIVPVAIEGEHEAADGPAAPPAADGAARAALMAERVAVASAAADNSVDPSARGQRVAAAVVRALGDPGLAAPASHQLRTTALGWPAGVPIVIDGLMRALTGTLARAPLGGDPRQAFLTSGIGHVEPVLLGTRGVLPAGWSVATGGEGRAVFVPALALHSLDVAADGTVTAGRTWPSAITAEVPWGSEGGALAWNAVDETAHLRSQRDGVCISAPAPFKPMHAAVASSGAIYWTDAQAGLWRWTPGRAATRVATLPAAGIPRFEGNDLVVTPMPRDGAGRAARQRLRYEWRVDRTTGAIDMVATDAAGQCAKVAVGEHWTARSHPCADLVRLDRAGADPVLLACYAPLGVAWAGASLIVIAGGATALMFTRLLDQLDALEAGPRLAL